MHISNGGACRLSKGSNSIVISSSWDNESLRIPATTHMRNVRQNGKKASLKTFLTFTIKKLK